MENAYSPHVPDAWLGRLSVHQDYFWFVSLLAWCLAVVVWWRHPDRRTTWAWLTAPACAALTTTILQFGMFNPTFDIFQSRLIPGTVADYRPAPVDPYWLGDILIGAAFAAMAILWCWQKIHAGRQVALHRGAALVALGAGIVHITHPQLGGTLLAGVTLLLAGGFLRSTAGNPAARIALVFSALIPALSTIGPAAAISGTIQRFGPPTITGLFSGAFQMLLGCAVLTCLARSAYAAMPAEKRSTLWPDARGFLWAAVAMLLAGISYGVVTGRDNRREILENRLRTTAGHAAVFDPALLAPLAQPQFWAKQATPKDATPRARTPRDDGAEPARQRLLKEVVSTPFLLGARITVVRDGWLIAALSSESGEPIEYLRRATPADLEQWENPKPYFEESPIPEIGYYYFTRAPILSADGRMLGWLEGTRSEFYLTVERRWRAAPFIMTALGIVLLALIFAQRRSTRDREAALRAAAVAAESNRIKTTFFANVSHELRTPLQNILGYSELLQRDPTGANRPRHLAALQQQGELMKRLVNDLIDLSAVDAGAFQLSPRAASPASLVEHSVESLRPRADAKGLALHHTIEASVPPWLFFDGERFRQVVLNLVTNAVKFTSRGQIQVNVSASAAPGHAADHCLLTLTVADTGPGISAAEQERLFRPFSRLAATAHHEGSGLGLALSAALCGAMGGSLCVESDGRSGSRFIATLVAPRTAAPAEPAPGAAAPAAGVRRRVLVVDDNTLMRELFTSFLDGQGAACASVSCGREALAHVATTECDVILLDLALPDGSGADFVAPLRAHQPRVRIIGVSAHAGLDEREHALRAGMDAFLVKPVELALLWRTVIDSPAAPDPAPAAAMTAAINPALFAAFARELPEKHGALTAAVGTRDWKKIRALAHYLRNSALVVQAPELFDACTALEDAATREDAVALVQGWPRVDVELARLGHLPLSPA